MTLNSCIRDAGRLKRREQCSARCDSVFVQMLDPVIGILQRDACETYNPFVGIGHDAPPRGIRTAGPSASNVRQCPGTAENAREAASRIRPIVSASNASPDSLKIRQVVAANEALTIDLSTAAWGQMCGKSLELITTGVSLGLPPLRAATLRMRSHPPTNASCRAISR